jgi:hypothetical protein
MLLASPRGLQKRCIPSNEIGFLAEKNRRERFTPQEGSPQVAGAGMAGSDNLGMRDNEARRSGDATVFTARTEKVAVGTILDLAVLVLESVRAC